MYHYSPEQALQELKEEGLLPNPVHLRDMLFRARPQGADSIELNREFQDYIKHYGQCVELGRQILEKIESPSG